MNNITKAALALIGIILLVVFGMVGAYNGLASQREAVVSAQAQIDTALQRRADLIPNLAASVQSFAAHETEVLDAVLSARAALQGASTLEEKAAADESLTQALHGLQVVVENYPDLKSDTVYIGLMDELSGSENRIAVARRDYNQAVQAYNGALVRFPNSALARMFGFSPAAYFTAGENAQSVPDVAGLLGS